MEDLPGPLRLGSAFPFVGRSATLEALRKLMPTAGGEGRRVVLLGGEPGSGKTRLVREFARETAGNGVLVLYGACDAVVRMPYGPFVEALDHLVRVTESGALRAAMGPAGGELARLLPDLPLRVGELPPPVRADADTERHRLHTAVADLLTGVTRERPALLVLEDGHWADASSLLLLRYLARVAGGARVLLLATFRDTEADVPELLAETLADLRRSDDVVRLRLGGLSREEVADLVRAATGGEPGPELGGLAQAICDLTGGNAFLVCELWRALVETGAVTAAGGSVRVTQAPAELGSPDSVREVVSQRLSRLTPGTGGLLELAAVAGAEFDLGVIRRAAGLGEAEFLTAFDEALRSGMLEELPRGLVGRFTHELVRRALHDRLSAVRRAELHLRVAESLEAAGPRSGRALADLAHHFAAAAPFGGRARAVGYNLQAARAAASTLAFDESAARLRAALELGIDRPEDRASTLLELGSACNRGGKAADALRAFTAGAGIAREVGDPELLARAATGYEEACWRPGIAGEGSVELLTEAAAALGDESSQLRVGLLSGLARALERYRGDHDGGAAARTQAIAMARALGDRAGLATALVRSYWSRGVSPHEEILAMLTEARELARELGDNEILAESMAWRAPSFVALGDLGSARREVAELLATAERTAQPFMHHVADHYGSALALCDGRLAEAEALARRSHDWSRLLTGHDASGVYGIQMFSIRREQGRLADLAPVARILAGDAKHGGPWRPGLIALFAELGLEAEARRELARLAAGGLGQFQRTLWVASLTYLADAAAELRDDKVAALIYPELAPLAGTNLMIGHLVSCYGAADRYLGMLAAVLGDADRAGEHFERGLELNRRMGAATWLAHTAYEYARFLLTGRRHHGRAQALAAEAAALAERIGMPALLARIRRLGPAAPRPALPGGLSPREVQILGLLARGLSNREIGTALSISEHTAANHVRSILNKTGCANRAEAVSYGHRHQLLPA